MNLGFPEKGSVSLLFLGAHSDDIEIGCGGTLLLFKAAFSEVKVLWVVFSAHGQRRSEAQKAAGLFTEGCDRKIILMDYRDGFLPYKGEIVKDFFEELKGQFNPDLIFTHWLGDAHQDHRLISDLTWNTFRDHLILEYEIPKYDGDMGRPNVFVPLERPVYEQKLAFLFEAFESQHVKRWFDRETFLGLMRVRGMEANAPSGYAEAFHARKVAIDPSLGRETQHG